MTQCMHCGTELGAATVCPGCGAAVPQASAQPPASQPEAPVFTSVPSYPPAGAATPPPSQPDGQAFSSAPVYQQSTSPTSPPSQTGVKKPVNKGLIALIVGGVLLLCLCLSLLAAVLVLRGKGDKSTDPLSGRSISTQAALEETASAESGLLDITDAGFYQIISANMDGVYYDYAKIKDAGFDGYSVTLNEDGSAIVQMDDYTEGKWVPGLITASTGEELYYTRVGDEITVTVDDLTMSFTRGELLATQTAAQEKFNGTWYGFFWITEGYGEWSDYEGDLFDAFMIIDLDENNEGTMSIFVDDSEDKTVDAFIKADEAHFEVTSGDFWDMELDPENWWIGLSPIDSGKKLTVLDVYTDPELTEDDGFEFVFTMRPFGELWDEEIANDDKIPPGYDSYLEHLAAGETYPYTVQEDDSSEPAPDSEQEPDTEEPAGSTEYLPAAKLREIYDTLAEMSFDEQKLLTYDDVVEKYMQGVQGEVYKEDDTYKIYIWRAQEADYQQLSITFKPIEEGSKDFRLSGNMSISNIPKP